MSLRHGLGGWRRALLILAGVGVLLGVIHLQPAAAATDGRLVLLLDSSGSMADRISGGTKIAIAKKALNRVVDTLPGDAQVGLRVYGATIEDEHDRRACTDTDLVVPIGTANAAALKQQIARYRPLGSTPISYSLEQAAKDLGESGRRTVVLVSDGRETCGKNPCTTAANLARQGIDLKVDVIGLGVSGSTRDQLRCIADRGRGTYADAQNAQQVEESLDQLATRAFRPFQLTGTTVRGNEKKGAATLVGPGQYLDKFPGRVARDIWYRVPRTQPGSTLHVGITARATQNASAATIRMLSPDGQQCAYDVPQNYQGLTSGGVSSYRDDPANACNTADHVLVSVQAPSSPLVGAAFELLVVEEPALASDRDLPPFEKPTWGPMPSTATTKAPVPGLSLSDAPLVTTGSYSASILTGETQVFAVELGWGQQLQAQTVVAPRHGALARALGGGDKLSLGLIGPSRKQYILLRGRDQPQDRDFLEDGKTAVQSATTPQVRYLNRTDFDAQAGDLPGLTYVVVTMNRFAHPKAFLIPYTLKIAVTGTAGEGAPEYVQASPSPTPTPSSTPTGAPTTPPATPPGSSTGVPVAAAVGIGLGALVLGGAGVAAALLVRGRRRARVSGRPPTLPG